MVSMIVCVRSGERPIYVRGGNLGLSGKNVVLSDEFPRACFAVRPVKWQEIGAIL